MQNDGYLKNQALGKKHIFGKISPNNPQTDRLKSFFRKKNFHHNFFVSPPEVAHTQSCPSKTPAETKANPFFSKKNRETNSDSNSISAAVVTH